MVPVEMRKEDMDFARALATVARHQLVTQLADSAPAIDDDPVRTGKNVDTRRVSAEAAQQMPGKLGAKWLDLGFLGKSLHQKFFQALAHQIFYGFGLQRRWKRASRSPDFYTQFKFSGF